MTKYSGYVFRPMNEGACAVVSWRYEAPYDFFYDTVNDLEVFTRYNNGGEHPFLLMTREA